MLALWDHLLSLVLSILWLFRTSCQYATWTNDPSDQHSFSDYCVFLGGSLIIWKTKKYVAVSCLSAKAK
jgi:hypothetical protein